MHICNLRTRSHAHLRFADAICGRAHMHIWDLRTCTYAICGRAIVSTCLPRGCNVFATLLPWQTRGNNCTSANRVCARPQIPDVHVCTSANRRCACVRVRKSRMCMHVPKSQMCMCARPQIADVHVMTAATYRANVRLTIVVFELIPLDFRTA